MTTAHRPTFDPAQGKAAPSGSTYHSRYLPAHRHLKVRQQGQGGAADSVQRDLRSELLKAEAAVLAKRKVQSIEDQDTDASTTGQKRKEIEDGNISDEDDEVKRRRLILEQAAEEDADEESEEDDDGESSEEEEDDEDNLLLQRELAKIKAEKQAQLEAEEAERKRLEEEAREIEIAKGNPLLNKTTFSNRRPWDDDVVFKHQSRGVEERGKSKEFVNDLLRSDFHKKFMSKYVR